VATTITKYDPVISTLGAPQPAWVSDPDDKVRVAAYDAYDNMYANAPGTFRLAMRGTNDKPVYIPSTRRLIEATNRYLGKNWQYTLTSISGNAQDVIEGKAWLDRVYALTHAHSKFYSFKRNMLIKGDAVFHVVADLSKPSGSRIRVLELNPRTYFRIEDPTDPEELQGVYIVNLITTGEQATQVAVRQSYRYVTVGGKRKVQSQLAFFEPGFWDDRWAGHPALKPVPIPVEWDTPDTRSKMAGQMLPDSVTTIPVYHGVNNRADEDPYGASEISGIESVIASLNQSMSDEDITLALQGLGLYVTTASAPINADTGEQEDWLIAPGYVIEIQPGTEMKRVDGLPHLVPFQQHMQSLTDSMDKASGVTATAVGSVDVTVAASGVALRLDMAPILAKNMEKEVELIAVLDNMGQDLLDQWAKVDGVPVAEDLLVTNTFDDPLPIDRAGIVTEVTALVGKGLMSRAFAVTYLKSKLGYDFPDDMLDQINADIDKESARLAQEIASQQTFPSLAAGDPGTGDGSVAPQDSLTGANA